MDYLSLYRKWRPQRFDEGFVGQEHLVRTITNAIIQDRVAHAYLFNGPRGTGKTTAAKILAKSLNCIKRGADPNPCNACPNCEKINAGVSLDVLEIDGASNRGIDEVRDLREKIKFAPVEGEYKVYIIDEVHMLTTEAFNALLKTLEEPPSHIIFVFATTEAHKLPATILSRCQRFDFKPLTPEEIFKHLSFLCNEEQFTAEPAALQIIAREAGGGLRDAIGLLEQSMAHAEGKLTVADVQAILGLIETEILFSLARAVAEEDIQSGLGLIKQVLDSGKDLQLFARQTARFFRDLIVLLIVGEQAPVTLDAEWKAQGSEVAGRIGLDQLKKGVDLFLEAGMGLKRGIEGTLPLEMALVQLISQQETPLDSVGANSSPIKAVDPSSLGEIKALQERLAALEQKVSVILAKQESIQGVRQEGLLPEMEKQTTPRQTKDKAKTPRKSETAPSGAEQKANNREDLGEVLSAINWDDVLLSVRKRKRTVEALLREGKPGVNRGNTFVIEFLPDFKFHWENIKRADNLRLVEEALEEVTGRKLKAECVLKNKEDKKEEGELTEKPEILRNALDLFGGKVIEPD